MPLDLDKLNQKKARRSVSGWTPKEGDNTVRILPHTKRYFDESLDDFAVEFYSHFLKAEGMDTVVVRCLRDKGEKCPFCESVRSHRESTDQGLKKAADDIRRAERHLMNIVDLTNIDSGIQHYECGPMVYDGVLDYAANPQWGDIFSPEKGCNLILNLISALKSRSGYNTYKVQPHRESTDIRPHLKDGWEGRLDEVSAAIPEYPSPDVVTLWMEVLFPGTAGNSGAAPNPAPVAPPTGNPAAPVATPPAAQPTPAAAPSPVPAIDIGGEVQTWAANHDLQVRQEGDVVVPQCFSTGAGTGFNPKEHPCDDGCPVRSDCQLKHLGLG